MTTTFNLNSFRQIFLPKSYELNSQDGRQKNSKREAFDEIGTAITDRLKQIFGSGGDALIAQLKVDPEIYDSGEVYDFSPEIQQAIQQSNTEYMKLKNSLPKKS